MNLKTTLLLIALVSTLSCTHKKSKIEGMPPVEVEVVIAQDQLVPYRYTFVSQTSSNLDFTIEPRVNGYLMSKNYRSGQPVMKGDLLFEIEQEPYQIALSKARANVASARSTLTNAEANFNRVEPLAKIQALSQSELDAATAQLMAARAGYNVAMQELNNAKLQLSYTKIYAPHNGIGSSSKAVVGDYVGVGTNFAVLATVSYIDSVAVDLSLPVSKYLEVAGGDEPSYKNKNLLSDIVMELSDGSIYPQPGIYNYTKTEVDNSADAIILQVLFPNLDYALKAGQFVKIMATIGEPLNVVTIPQVCVTQTQNIYNVWVVAADSTAQFRNVTLGDVVGDKCVVKTGLSAGEKVISGGFFKLRNGAKVSVLP